MPSVVDRLRSLADALPDGAAVTLPLAVVRAWLEDEPAAAPPSLMAAAEPPGWRVRLWTCPDDARLGVQELAEAVGRSADWVYRATSATHAAEHGRDPLPCSKLDGVNVFRAGAVRRWLEASAVIVNAEPTGTRTRIGRALNRTTHKETTP